MIRNPIDVATRVSPSLSALIESRLNHSEPEEYITLLIIRDYVTGLLSAEFTEAEQIHHFDINESLLDELNALIEEFGETALAHDFVQNSASESMSRVIDAVISNREYDNPPTLEIIKQAIVMGLPASLVGDGVLDEDEDDGLLAEIDALINRHGADAIAEEFLRYE
ncbi:hypothetical protein [Nitrosomonas aestuarii]|uniref:Uncharacterized protein n=1 Tax=Nitrosomonas aestuarii TaxID=52441 RepID=A0A1I3Z1F3_9PROT|nr:hypothetical protein [Nitrosomonas aestuarii]PTN11038.1 hypothetical protein C8R11_11436 [Nitrosomonas aestuarii]SFK37918.1 hypothetical protein SAMN05216302_100540 [Nitrosomonas aestuarii]